MDLIEKLEELGEEGQEMLERHIDMFHAELSEVINIFNIDSTWFSQHKFTLYYSNY